jgi:hypothetical protein
MTVWNSKEIYDPAKQGLNFCRQYKDCLKNQFSFVAHGSACIVLA